MGQGDIYTKAEGVYTTWTLTGIWDSGFVPDVGNDIVNPRNNGDVLYHDLGTKTNYIISSAGALLATIPDEKGVFSGRSRSLTDMYLLFRDSDNDDIIVQKGIAELWRRAVTLDRGGYVLSANPILNQKMSANGEWVVVLVKENTNNGLIFIYKGS